ncbi:HEAT repeat domain-containing protein [Streptomyces sp. NPDC087218]|uniref:HEAT repeat domain-containing protein n=1 Tax=Streptomyces sp. NPDC087218 TaxID=3365769 RepID=UPI00380019E1
MSAEGAGAERMARFAAEVDWSRVTSPYHAQRYGPEVLEQLWAPDHSTAEGALVDLHHASCGDGSSVLAAAAEVLPFLVEAARDLAVTVRAEIMETVTDVARAGNAALTARADPVLEGRWRPTVDPAWPAAWERAVDPLLPLLDDDDPDVRAAAVTVLAQAAHRADELTARFRDRFGNEQNPRVAETLVLAVGELARHTVERREEALAWLRQRMTVEEGEEPDIDEDVDAWLEWMEKSRHDVRLQAVAALRRALPDRPDPAHARTTADTLLASPPLVAGSFEQYRSWPVDVIVDADRQLGDDLPGRLALALGLLRHDGAGQRGAGLRVAASLMSRWRSAVPELLPAVAEFTDDPHPDNRASALRVLAMCGAAARPWADRAAARLTEDEEPHEPARRYAVWALSRMGDERCVAPLARLLTVRGSGFGSWPPSPSGRGWDKDDLNFSEALAPFTAHTGTLLGPLLARIGTAPASERGEYHGIIGRWHRDGAPVVPRLLELLESPDPDEVLTAAHALSRTGPRAIAAGHRARLRELLGPPEFWADSARVDPFRLRFLTGDDEPVLALLRSPEESGYPELSAGADDGARIRACIALGPLAAPAADLLRGLFQEALRGGPEHRSDASKDVVRRARALWRVTGDAGEVLPDLLELTGRSAQEGCRTPGGVEALRLLAEVAATRPPVVERVARRLRATAEERLGRGNRFDAMEIVRSLWELTRDPRQVVPALNRLVRICPPPGRAHPTVLEPLELLAEVAAADPESVTPVTPALRALLDADERPVAHDHWRAVMEDDALCAAVRAVLDAAATGAEEGTGEGAS